ncbi:MAG: insulinase family protein [Phycisphaerales bacterium]|nr:MAG: insulinase family protein [Phycisphaerales bacterium]
MNAKQRLMTVTAVVVVLIAWTAPLSAEPLPSDSRVITGKLENGVTWMYRQHDNPPGKMSLMAHVDAGSLNETDQQRGLAHFMEHMVFNGTENFPPGTLIPYFESIGMEFGNDLNAFTGFDQTAYMLFLPDTEAERVDKGLMVLSDYVFRSLLLEEEIDRERGVILAEARTGKSAEQRMRDKLWPELYEGSRFAERIVIGKEEIIASAPRSEFVDFYRTWYRPENITVLLVGDAKPDGIIPLVKKWFGQYKPEAPAREPLGPEFKPFTKQRAIVVTDPEMTRCDVEVTNIRPGRPPTTTVEQWRTDLVEEIGTWIIGRRYQERVDKGEASYRNARASVRDFYQDAVMASASASGEPEDWARMIEELVAEVNRVQKHGFTERELELAKKEMLADAERAVRTEPTTDARRFLFQMLRAVSDEEPVLSAQQRLDLYQKLLPGVGLDEVNATFKKHFEPGTFAYVVEMPEKEGVAAAPRDEVLAMARAAWTREVSPIEKAAGPGELLASLPAPGKVVESAADPDLGITSAWLANGVRVHHRFMDYKKDTVMVSIALAGGGIEETKANAGITSVANLAIDEPATHRLSSTNIRDLMTGKNISVGTSVRSGRMGRRRGGSSLSQGGDAVMISVQGSPKDLEAGLQLAHALLTDGKIEEAAFKNWKLQTLQQLERMQKMPMFKAMEATADLLSGGDPRRTFLTAEEVNRQSVSEAQAWYDRLCAKAPIEVAVVGDIKLDEAMPLIERYLGSLAERNRGADHLAKLRRLARPTGPLSRHLDIETITPQGMAMAGFVAAEGRNAYDRRALELASQILSTRLIKHIREDQGLVYSIRARYQPSWIYEDSGEFAAGAPCDPDKARMVAEQIHKEFEEFAQKGPTEEELANAKKQVANNLDTEMKEPSYWWGILRHHDLHGRNLAEEKVEKEAFEKYTADQIRSVFAKYYKPTRQFSVTVVPTAAGGEEGEKAVEQATAPGA